MDFATFLKELGGDKMTDEEQKEFLGHVVKSLETRVGLRLSTILTEEQMDHLEKVTEEKGHEAATKELERIYPDHRKLYEEELEKLKDSMLAMLPPDSE